jgi:DNA uptake protein ComE-like DNA-binding protein
MKPNFFNSFNKKERIGLLTTVGLLFLLALIYFFLPNLIQKPNTASNQQALKQEVEFFIQQQKKEKAAMLAEKKEKKKEKKLSPFYFDPNTLPVEGWLKMGFSRQQATIIDNYRKSGAVFRTKEDLTRVYGIDEQEYAQIKPYIRIPSTLNTKKIPDTTPDKNSFRKPEYANILIDINSADSAELTKLRGIGPVFASRIVKFRHLVGGFYRPEQIMEVYGIDSSRFLLFADHISVGKNQLQRININTCTFKELLHHPYMDYYLVKEIMTYRQEHGRFDSIEELQKIRLMYPDLYLKIKPYLTTK